MFRCHFCQKITPPKTPKQYVVVATREKYYPTRRREDKRPRGRFRSREDAIQDRGGKGIEIAQEVPACPECAALEHEVKLIEAAPLETEVEETPAAE